ncbi:MAG TPA: LAGLIDADG family homing endonuclease, partial [Streptosporangiaceae bacterium]
MNFPARRDPPVLEGRVVGEPARTVPRQAARVIVTAVRHDRVRAAGRNVAYIGIGAAVITRRLWESRSTARYERSIRSAEAAGDHEAALAWDTQRVKFLKDRHARRADLVELPLKVFKALPGIAAGFLGILAVTGVLLAIAGRNAKEIAVPVRTVAHIAGWVALAFSVSYGPFLLALPWIVLLVLYLAGRSYANASLTAWSVAGKDDGEDPGLVVTADTIVLALQHLPNPALKAAFKNDWRPVFHTLPVRDGRGYSAVFSLPLGVTAGQVADQRPVLARNVHRAEVEVWPSDAEKSGAGPAGTVAVWIADRGVLSRPAPEYPLLHEGTADVFSGVPAGVSPRGDAMSVPIAANNFVAGGQMGQGKALALDTPVPTPSGWATMGELAEGDLVFGEDGQPCRVVTAWPVRYGHPCYEVEFSDGTVITADAEHLWLADTRASRVSASAAAALKHRDSPFSNDQRAKRSMPKVLTTAEMAATQRVTKYGWVNYSIRVAAPLHAPDANLPVAPYTLGAWLGDGSSATGLITGIDPEIITGIESEGEKAYRLPCSDGKCPLWRVEGLTRRLRFLGVQRNKHIPAAYLRASEAQRRALLAGLLDTDGYCDRNGTVQFSVISERLARDVRHLVSGLGYKSGLRSKPARLNGKDCGTAWLVTFTPPDKVFRLPRKTARQVSTVRTSAAHRYVTAIRPVPSVPVRCIAVDSPSHLYLVGETCIATHNSNACRVVMLGAALDPLAELWVHVLASNGDFDAYAPRLARYVRGAEDEHVAAAVASLAELYEEVGRREGRLADLGAKKLTRGLAQQYPDLRPKLALFSECHELFGHSEHGQLAADLAVKTMRRARKTGIWLGFDTQSARKDAIPPRIVELVSINCCFYVKSWRSNDGFLGDG